MYIFDKKYQNDTCTYSKMHTNNDTMKHLIFDNSTSSLHFVLSESCFWSATILTMKDDSMCPICTDSNVAFIPLSINESSRLSISAKSWLEALLPSTKKGSIRHRQGSANSGLVRIET